MTTNTENTQTQAQNVLIPGTLKVKTIVGTSSEFKVGEVSLPFAQVEISNKWLENFEEGLYEGTFLLAKMHIKPVVCRGGSVMNVLKADIPEFNIIEANEGADTDIPDQVTAERQDPAMDDVPTPQAQTPSNKPVVTTESKTEDKTSVEQSGEMTEVQELFGPIYGPQCLTLDDLPDVVSFSEDVIDDRQLIRKIANLINVKKGGTHKYDVQAKAWNRVTTLKEQNAA